MATFADLISISPDDRLVFHLKKDQENRVVRLFIRNISSEKVAFKVKTTMPDSYFVKPNQGILGNTPDDDRIGIDIALTKEEKNRLIELSSSGIHEKTSKHRFMVQNKAITETEFEQLQNLPAGSTGQRAEMYAQVWATTDNEEKAKQDKMKKMLSVEFIYPAWSSTGDSSNAEATNASGSAPETSVSENVDILRNRLAYETNAELLKSSTASGNVAMVLTKENILEDLEKLKERYDAMIQYTVSLTSERDSLVLSLENAQREKAKEAARLKKEASGASSPRSAGGDVAGAGAAAQTRSKTQTFNFLEVPFYFMVLAAFLAFVVGKMIK